MPRFACKLPLTGYYKFKTLKASAVRSVGETCLVQVRHGLQEALHQVQASARFLQLMLRPPPYHFTPAPA